MSLQVWLPLTKDLRQQGLSNVTVTNNGATFNSAGKLGGCYSFNRSSSNYLKIDNPITTATNGVSMAFWVKIPSNASGNNQIVHIGNGAGWNNNRCTCFIYYGSSSLIFSCSDGQGTSTANSTQYSCKSSALTLNSWTHVVCTYGTGKMKIYLNGVLDKDYTTTIIPSFTNTSYIGVGAAPDAGEPATVYVNDVRIYDHCLSPMEVKELAKGLVLHYPLNRQGWGQENLVWDTHWDEISTKWSGWGSPPVREIVNTFGKKYLHVKSSDRWQGYSQNQAKRSGVGEITAGEKLTLSCWAYSNTTLTSYPCIGIHWTDGSSIIAQSWPSLTITTTPQKFITVLTVPSGVSAFNIMVGNGSGTVSGVYEIWVADVKLERGEKSTPWCPNSSDTLATTMGLNSTTEYDCSGFCNNGTRTGTFTWTSDTPKYAVSQYFEDYTRYITTPLNGWIPTAITLSCWIKGVNKTPRGNWHIPLSLDGQKAEISIGTSGKARIGFTISGTRYTYDWGNNILDNNWHMITNVFNGSSMKMYIDGELINTHDVSGSLQSMNNLYVGRFNGVDTYGNTQLYQSDVRIYATALSADDVKSLYQNSAYIDSSGNVYGAVHSEV